MPRSHRLAAILTAAAMLAPAALAHPGESHTHNLLDGLTHPLLGIDHLLVMLAVGAWAAMQERASLWIVPLTFVSGMAAGLLSGVAPAFASVAEAAIILSLTGLGLMLALAIRVPGWLAAMLAAAAGLAHGMAHAVETPPGGIVGFAIGALLTTAALHATGALAGLAARRRFGLAVRLAGAALAVTGPLLAISAA